MPQFVKCDYVSHNLIIATAERGHYLISRDDGKTWEKGKVETYFERDLIEVDFCNEQFGAMISNYDLFITNDSGYTWQRQKMPLNQEEFYEGAMGIQVIGKDTIYLLTIDTCGYRKYNLLKSFDMGKTWDRSYISIYQEPYIRNISFINKDTGWAAAFEHATGSKYYDMVFKTTNAGKSWELQLDTFYLKRAQYQIQNIEFKNKDLGLIWGHGINFGGQQTEAKHGSLIRILMLICCQKDNR